MFRGSSGAGSDQVHVGDLLSAFLAGSSVAGDPGRRRSRGRVAGQSQDSGAVRRRILDRVFGGRCGRPCPGRRRASTGARRAARASLRGRSWRPAERVAWWCRCSALMFGQSVKLRCGSGTARARGWPGSPWDGWNHGANLVWRACSGAMPRSRHDRGLWDVPGSGRDCLPQRPRGRAGCLPGAAAGPRSGVGRSAVAWNDDGSAVGQACLIAPQDHARRGTSSFASCTRSAANSPAIPRHGRAAAGAA